MSQNELEESTPTVSEDLGAALPQGVDEPSASPIGDGIGSTPTAARAACSTVASQLSELLPSDCGCGGKKSPSSLQKVYVIGKLGFDYGTRQRREYFRNRLQGDPDNDANLVRYLMARPEGPTYNILNGPVFTNRADITSLIWILKIDETPVYAISPTGAFAFEMYDTLVTFLKSQLKKSEGGEDVERMAVSGVIVGETRLFTGEQVPLLAMDQRGLANWTTDALLATMQQIVKADQAAEDAVRDILDRLYEMTRNLGVASHDRALNYAATDALLVQGIVADGKNQSKFAGLELDTIHVEKSPICRPDYDCWDIVIAFYNPKNLQEARRGMRYTVDVSDTMPHIVSGSQRVFSLR
jgi:cyanobactin maturation PatA/PatG family protease